MSWTKHIRWIVVGILFLQVGCLSAENQQSESSSKESNLKIDELACSINSTKYASSTAGFIYSLFVDSFGSLFRGGSEIDSSYSGTWKIHRFESNTWVESDSVHNFNDHMIGMVEADDGSLVAIGKGMSTTSSHSPLWVVRRSTDAGQTWNTVESLDGKSIKQIFKTSNGVLLVGGGVFTSITTGHLTQTYEKVQIRRSMDNGDSWMDINSAGFDGTQNERFLKMAEDSLGRLYYVVEAGEAPSPKTIVRTSVDGGSTWITVSVLENSTPDSFVADASGQVLLGHHEWFGAGWTISKSSDGGVSWSVLDQPGNIPNGTPSLMEVSPDGRIVVVGNYSSAVDNVAIIVRASDDGGFTWKNIDSYGGGVGQYPIVTALAFSGTSFFLGGYVHTGTGYLPPFVREYDCH